MHLDHPGWPLYLRALSSSCSLDCQCPWFQLCSPPGMNPWSSSILTFSPPATRCPLSPTQAQALRCYPPVLFLQRNSVSLSLSSPRQKIQNSDTDQGSLGSWRGKSARFIHGQEEKWVQQGETPLGFREVMWDNGSQAYSHQKRASSGRELGTKKPSARERQGTGLSDILI